MELLKEIRLNFAAKIEGKRKLENLPVKYPAWTFKIDDQFGVAIENVNDINIVEKFANSKIASRMFIDENGNDLNMIVLSCDQENLRNEFAILCAYFVDPGNKGEVREQILTNPIEWWEKLKELVGNAIINKKPYSVLGELLVLEYLIKQGESVEWTGADSAIYDIESESMNYEIKSTIKKYQSKITISSQFQLESKKKLILYFCRFEPGVKGESIDSVIDRLIKLGFNKESIEMKLEKLNMEKGSHIRKEKYKLLEKRRYDVDSHFPKITRDSFIDGKIPESIIHISYTIDLDGIEYSVW